MDDKLKYGWWSNMFNQYITVINERVDVVGIPLIDGVIIEDGKTYPIVFRHSELIWQVI